MADLLHAALTTARLREMRDTLRSVMGDRFPALAQRWRLHITTVAQGKGVDTLQAAILLAKAAGHDAYAVIAILASYVEMIEPSSPSSRPAESL